MGKPVWWGHHVLAFPSHPLNLLYCTDCSIMIAKGCKIIPCSNWISQHVYSKPSVKKAYCYVMLPEESGQYRMHLHTSSCSKTLQFATHDRGSCSLSYSCALKPLGSDSHMANVPLGILDDQVPFSADGVFKAVSICPGVPSDGELAISLSERVVRISNLYCLTMFD